MEWIPYTNEKIVPCSHENYILKTEHIFIEKKCICSLFNKYLLQVLCLHIKRFRWQSFFRVKLETFVEFPLEGLNMHKYILDNLVRTIVFCRQSTI